MPDHATGSSVLSLFSDNDPARPEQRAIDELVIRGVSNFLRSQQTPGVPTSRYEEWFRATEVPSAPIPIEDYLAMLFSRVVPYAVRTHGRRFVGHMTSSLPSFVDPLGRVMTLLNQNVVKLETSNAFTFYERQSLAMLHRLVYRQPATFYDEHTQNRESTLGMITSGGTLANVAGLWIARNRAFGRVDGGPNIEVDGLADVLAHRGYRRAVVVGSTLMHYSLRKAVDLLGLGDANLVRVPARTNGGVDPEEVRKVLAQQAREGARVIALVGIGGTTETGQVDPLVELAGIAREAGVHFHVDAAWGGPTVFSRKYEKRVAGLDLADTVVIDGHKQLYLPMGIGVLLARDATAATAIEKVANYIIRAGSVDLGRRTLEGSRPAMAVFLHGALHMVGLSGYEQLVDGGIERAEFMADEIRRRPQLELLCEPVLNILVYRYVPAGLRGAAPSALAAGDQVAINQLNERIQEAQRDAGEGFISRTTLTHTRYGTGTPIVALRAVLANPLTQESDLREVLEQQVRIGELLEREGS